MRKKQVKRKTTLPKIAPKKRGRLKEIESSTDGTVKNVIGASQADIPCGGQCGRDVENELKDSRLKAKKIRYVPVVDKNGNRLMETTSARARKWIKSKKATWFWHFGIYCVRLNVEPSGRKKQDVCCGGDTDSKKEAMTLKSELHTYLNVQSDAVTWVKENVETRSNLRRTRRYRNSPCRKNKTNRSSLKKNKVPPSTKSRWQVKLRMIDKFSKVIPITHFNYEDVAAVTKKGKRKWNLSFSPLEVGKQWFYDELRKRGILDTKAGHETAELRKNAGLKKSKNKMSENFDAHCVDSWVLANHTVGGHITPDNIDILYVTPLQFHRRRLHVQQPAKGGVRKKYGGTMSMGFKRGSIVIHPKHGLCFVGGTSTHKQIINSKKYEYDRISLHSLKDGKRLSQQVKPTDVKFLTYNSFLTRNYNYSIKKIKHGKSN